MTSTYRTKTGRILTEGEVDDLADVVETTDYDVELLKKRRRGRPAMGSGPADVVAVRIDSELRAAVEARAESEETSASAVIREAIRLYLEVA